MTAEVRQYLKQAVSARVTEDLEQGKGNPLTSVADHWKDLIGQMFLAELPRRTQRRSIFGSIVEYEGGHFD